ncbi:uncharacterized protein LOC132257658 isoform X2 [Phlebotomus argentipes]|uniref:uncharacterized protein LOC132257658 isoform X2 n=1 Tax=Phlebotomus argentipes TaxID=94469 RepID=UPI002892F956|nr:uncharacterized protein LOC132257658 isoform X2 [Phlebotomus argentipes]
MDFILSKIISRPRGDAKGCDKVANGNGVESPQKSQLNREQEEIPVKETLREEGLCQSSGNLIGAFQPEGSNWRETEKFESDKDLFEDHRVEGIANYSALSSDDEAFVECHSFIGENTIENPPVLNQTEEHSSSAFDSGTESRSPGRNDVSLIAKEFVEEIVCRALELLPKDSAKVCQDINKTIDLDDSEEDCFIVADSTLIIDKDVDTKASLDDEILKFTENLANIKISEKCEEKEIVAENLSQFSELNGTFEVKDVSMRSVDNLNATFDAKQDLPEVVEIKEDVKEENLETQCKMPETVEHNLSRNESFDEAISRDSPKDSSVSSSFSNLNNQPDSATLANTFVENLITENVDFAFKVPEVPGDGPMRKKKLFGQMHENLPESAFAENDFQSGSEFEFTQSDLDYLLTKGGNCGDPIDRSSLLLRFDPLLNQPVPAANYLKASFTRQQQESPITEVTEEEERLGETPNLEDTVAPCMSENDDLGCANTSDNSLLATTSCEYAKDLNSESDSYKDCLSQASSDATMSVDVIKEVVAEEVKSVANITSEGTYKKEYKMAELEKKIKNEVLKTEDIEKKLKEAEAREEALLKRITDNQKNITKMTGVLEAYEKTIAELIAEKQQIIESYEKKCSELQNERDLNFQHLTSLEGTFADLHVKYERSKQVTITLKKSEESLIAEKKQCHENLRIQEQRYEKMKSHAMQQLELANSKLDMLMKTHGQETAKLKALLKKEEISRLSTNEQLLQKTRENEELVKICDELINGSAPTS